MPTMTEVLERLGLSEEQRAAIQPLFSENQSLKTELAQTRKTQRDQSVTTRVKELQDQGFTPGFCKRYEEIALADDGEVAATLNLSENGVATGERAFTATQIADSLIAALPVDESGKLALADRGNLLTSPISERPAVDAEDQRKVEEKQGKTDGGTLKMSADEWLAAAEKASPGITAPLNLSTEKKGA